MNWKTPPADPTKKHVNRSLEMQILLACNWSCHACDAFSQFHGISFVKRATMSMAQVEQFIGEMYDHNAYIGRIRILGGEPTMHPKFVELVKHLHDMLVPDYVAGLEIITNGSHPEKHNLVKEYARVRISGEAAKQQHHTANLVHTPHSLGYEGKMCNAPWHCGFSLNYYGYFPCSAGAGIARMQDWMKWQRLELPVAGVRTTWPDLQELCNFCYHGLKEDDKIKCGTGQTPGQHALNVPSKEAWEHLAPWFAGKQPSFPIYGKEVSAAV